MGDTCQDFTIRKLRAVQIGLYFRSVFPWVYFTKDVHKDDDVVACGHTPGAGISLGLSISIRDRRVPKMTEEGVARYRLQQLVDRNPDAMVPVEMFFPSPGLNGMESVSREDIPPEILSQIEAAEKASGKKANIRVIQVDAADPPKKPH